MLKTTDERFVPWSEDFCTGYEHIHRYALSKKYAEGKRVLDLACGEGYGSSMLAERAGHVVGVDISRDAISHAKETYQKNNLAFITGKITEVPIRDNFSFDVIVCFEALEHIAEHEALLKEVKRLLKPDGVFIVSTPNKPVYSENGTRQNPFHLKELDFDDFQNLIRNHFKHSLSYGQKTYASSKIFPLAGSSGEISEYIVKKEPHGFELVCEKDPLPRYFIAIASDQRINREEGISYLADISARNGYVKWEIPREYNLPASPGTQSTLSKIREFLLKFMKGIQTK